MEFKHNDRVYGTLIFKALVGSHSHGTNIPESDEDYKYIYVRSPEDVLIDGYIEQIQLNKDEVAYELRRFIQLISTANPTMLELLNTPQDCIIYKHPVMDKLLEIKDQFLTKKCKNSFGGFIKSQIKKAHGLDKKIHQEKKSVERKNPIDFCWVVLDEKTKIKDSIVQSNNGFSLVEVPTILKQGVYPLKEWLEKQGLSEVHVVLTKLNHTKEGHQLFLQDNPKGIVSTKSNTLKTSATPKGLTPIATILFNSDDYSAHCKRYKEYQEWLKNRNTQRYVEIKEHGQIYDGKNLLHSVRILEMGLEIAQGKGLNMRRPNREYLISIRKGTINLEEVYLLIQDTLKQMDQAFDKSDLPEKFEGDTRGLLIEMRKELLAERYKNKK